MIRQSPDSDEGQGIASDELPTKRCALGTERFSGNIGGFEVITAESLQRILVLKVNASLLHTKQSWEGTVVPPTVCRLHSTC